MQRKREVEEVLSLSIQTIKMSMAREFSFGFSLIQSVSIIFSLFLVYVLKPHYFKNKYTLAHSEQKAINKKANKLMPKRDLKMSSLMDRIWIWVGFGLLGFWWVFAWFFVNFNSGFWFQWDFGGQWWHGGSDWVVSFMCGGDWWLKREIELYYFIG